MKTQKAHSRLEIQDLNYENEDSTSISEWSN